MLPDHLRRYVVDQDYSRYTPVDQEVWRYIMRQLKAFLTVHAHPCYAKGLEKTGIETDRIPTIAEMSQKLQDFGWQAVPVSGFIPPAAFMELQSLGYLPIASDMRTKEHLSYTPAPDIVHEAAGHAPILVDPDFASYLRSYAQVAKKALISREDMALYEAIRILSDVKEDPHSTPENIQKAEQHLNSVSHSMSYVSEASYLSRMNWWTAEYGLIGDLSNPKIFGAGLLSSVGEARGCLSPRVKKIPLTLDCINYSYDITEPQPQLFVTPDFNHLGEVLEELAEQMAFRRGGVESLEKAQRTETINTIELESGLQISGCLKDFAVDKSGDNRSGGPRAGRGSDGGSDSIRAAYLQFEGPTQLSRWGIELPGHGRQTHSQGFGTPLGNLSGMSRSLSEASDDDLSQHGVQVGRAASLQFDTGPLVKGRVTGLTRGKDGKLLLISFADCTVTHQGKIRFEPAWGVFDMAVGSTIMSVFGGPADRVAFGATDDFVAKVIPRKTYAPLIQYQHQIYSEVRKMRQLLLSGPEPKSSDLSQWSRQIDSLLEKAEADFPHDWLLFLDFLELSNLVPSADWKPRVEVQLGNLADRDPLINDLIADGRQVMRTHQEVTKPQ